MSSLRLNDIWRNVNQEIGFYTEETFDNIPSSPGVYAWFYPLRIIDKNLDVFMSEVQTILNYDSNTEGEPEINTEHKLAWETICQKLTLKPKNDIKNTYRKLWNQIVEVEEDWNEIRKTIMRSSILLPPLYVGKAIDLNSRCKEHINGSDTKNHFHKRYEEFARKNEVNSSRVSDLLFVCIKINENKAQSKRSEELVEEIIKHLSKPKYSIR